MPATVSGHPHGQVRGIQPSGRSVLFEGRFGRMFRALPPADFDPNKLVRLARAMTAPAEDPPASEFATDDEENVGNAGDLGIAAGYTYLGQFIDHDLTFDPASSLQKQNDPDALVDFRTPRFDLDCVYGRGPDDQPYLYEDGGVVKDAIMGRLMKLGAPLSGSTTDLHARDLPRQMGEFGGRARALIGDPRNDENNIVAQLQAAMIRFHNALSVENPGLIFTEVQRLMRWHYQWIVLTDFLPKIVGRAMVDSILPHLPAGTSIFKDKPALRFYHFRYDPYIPLEFAVAAYRFGHSMVRPIYRLNLSEGSMVDDPADPLNGRKDIFHGDQDDVYSLNGFRKIPDGFAIDWKLFFPDMGAVLGATGPGRLQPAYKIDTSLVNPLGQLPAQIAADIPSLAERNLLRSLRLGLPSGQDVARAMGEAVLKDDDIIIGKAASSAVGSGERFPVTHFGHHQHAPNEFAGKCPLWTYILAEAQQSFERAGHDDTVATRLGPVGGRIVAETMIGIMLGDSQSFLAQDPNWRPDAVLAGGRFTMATLLGKAMGYDHAAHMKMMA